MRRRAIRPEYQQHVLPPWPLQQPHGCDRRALACATRRTVSASGGIGRACVRLDGGCTPVPQGAPLPRERAPAMRLWSEEAELGSWLGWPGRGRRRRQLQRNQARRHASARASRLRAQRKAPANLRWGYAIHGTSRRIRCKTSPDEQPFRSRDGSRGVASGQWRSDAQIRGR